MFSVHMSANYLFQKNPFYKQDRISLCQLIQSLAQTDKMYMMLHIYISFNTTILYITQNFIMARFPAFERNKVHQILKIASISPERLT